MLLKIVVAAVLCVGVLTAYVTMSYPNTTTWRPTSWGLSEAAEYVFSAWLMLLGGMAAQRMIARRKSKDPTAAELRLTLTRWAKFAAAKATRIAETLLLSVVTLILYHSALKSGAPPETPDIISLSGAFFLGYGFDSFLDLVSSELDRRTSRNAALISFKPR